MKTKKIFLLTAALSVQLSFAQFAKVTDKDGYVNVRENADAKSKIVGKINTDEIVYIFESDPVHKNWANVSNGYIYSSKLKYIQSYKRFLPLYGMPTKRPLHQGILKSILFRENLILKKMKKTLPQPFRVIFTKDSKSGE